MAMENKMAMDNPAIWEAIKTRSEKRGRDPYEALQWFLENMGRCKRCGIRPRPEGGHICGACGEDI